MIIPSFSSRDKACYYLSQMTRLFQVGWTDICDTPYSETVEALRAIDIYATRR